MTACLKSACIVSIWNPLVRWALPQERTSWTVLFDGKRSRWVDGEDQERILSESRKVSSSERRRRDSELLFSAASKEYGDFELEFETKPIDPELNSGVQIRSKTREAKGKEKRMVSVNGPQVEVSQRVEGAKSYSGNIYGQGWGGWITPKDGRRQHSFLEDRGLEPHSCPGGREIRSRLGSTAIR